MKRYKYLQAGFTLVEIVVVICLIGILATIIILSLEAYQDNVDQTTISNTADAYAKSLKSYSIESNSYPKNSTCLPKGSKCCKTTSGAPNSITCLKTSEYSGNNWASTYDDAIAKYVRNDPPLIPTVDDWGACTSGLMSWGPCKPSTAVPIVGVTYVANIAGSDYTSTDTSLKNKGFLIYFVAPNFHCGTDKIMTLSGTNLVFNSTAKYSWQTSDLRECIVGLN
ncbi:MAG: type II secretion system protein [Candidatus Saccharibacteria bacterium]|nr:type II secretion system protein [Candidatus Saccharibacteria bacterium]